VERHVYPRTVVSVACLCMQTFNGFKRGNNSLIVWSNWREWVIYYCLNPIQQFFSYITSILLNNRLIFLFFWRNHCHFDLKYFYQKNLYKKLLHFKWEFLKTFAWLLITIYETNQIVKTICESPRISKYSKFWRNPIHNVGVECANFCDLPFWLKIFLSKKLVQEAPTF
jgi:hypothetical protein